MTAIGVNGEAVERKLARLDALEMALAHLPVGVGLFHIDGKPIYTNDMFKNLYNIDPNAIGPRTTFKDLIDGGHFAGWKIDPGQYFSRLIATLKSGREFSAEIEIGEKVVAVHDVPMEGRFILSTQQDITKRVHAERRVAHLANHDPLTDLPNRAAFGEKLAGAIDTARVKRSKFALLTVDLDRFKDVNDIFGHSAGDALLKEVSARFRRCLGDGFVARLGGDEFSFLSLEGNQPEAAGALASRLLESAEGEAECDGNMLKVGLSIGIAVYPDDAGDSVALLNHADAALYRAKADGRGVMRSFSKETDKRIREQRVLQQELRVAVARNEFVLHYQPQSNIDREVTGFEALLRWRHPSRGIVEADRFISLAEENGLIVEIGEWALREACREAAGWRKPLNISVNLSAVQFRYGDLAASIHQILLETGLAPARLEIEITESVLIQNFTRAIDLLRRIKNLGVHVAMDDFGIGYSSLSYLQSFPFDALKIDRSFIAKLGQNGNADEIVRAVIGLGRGLRLPIVAEGVETREQLAFLAHERCESIQGHLIGCAGPIADYAEYTGEADGAKAQKLAVSR